MRTRLWLAALTFFVSLFVLAGGSLSLLPKDPPEWLTTVVVLTAITLSLIITNKLVNAPGTNFWSFRKAPEPGEEPQEDEGLISSTDYRAVRCFEIAESREEGPHYFIELEDRSVLYLNGRYLLDYAPRKRLGVMKAPREFPCTEFTVRRDRYDGGVVGIQCRGTVLEPELSLPAVSEAEQESFMLLKDGDVISSRTYEELKVSRAGAEKGGRKRPGWDD